MQAPFFVIFVLIHIIFTPIESKVQHQNVRILGIYASGNYGGSEKAAGDACVAQLDEEYRSENADLATNSWGCIRVEHAGMPQPDYQHEGSGGRRS